MKNLTALTAKEILKFKCSDTKVITHLHVVLGKSKMIQDVSVYFNGKKYFATKGLLFHEKQNHKIECKGTFEDITNYVLSLAN